jgi:hypothetical protein
MTSGSTRAGYRDLEQFGKVSMRSPLTSYHCNSPRQLPRPGMAVTTIAPGSREALRRAVRQAEEAVIRWQLPQITGTGGTPVR